MAFPRISDLIDEFKKCCRSRGWKAYENDYLIEAENEYHKFFWIHHLHPSTFKKVVANSLCAICEGVSYRTVMLSYIAWVLPVTPSQSIWFYMIKEAPNLSRKVAIYDKSNLPGGAQMFKTERDKKRGLSGVSSI